jgi:hypothetical protein
LPDAAVTFASEIDSLTLKSNIMKTSSLILGMLMVVTTSFSAGNPTNERSKSLTVETSAWKADMVHIAIRETGGSVIMEETVSTRNDFRKYNLKNLPAGLYTLEISDDLKISAQSFKITNNSVEMEPETSVTYKPVITWSENNLDINFLACGKRTFVQVSDNAGKVVYAETVKVPAIHRRYNTSDLAAGSYTVTVYNSDISVSKEFRK